MISTVRGRFGDVAGSLSVPDGDFSRATLNATIGVDSLDTREPQRDAHLRSADFFDAANYPTITFASTRIVADPQKQGSYVLVGDLTIHGVTREVRLNVVSEGQGRDPWGNQRAGFSATARVSRKDFGLTWNQLLETGGVAVGDEVTITIDAEVIAKVNEAAA